MRMKSVALCSIALGLAGCGGSGGGGVSDSSSLSVKGKVIDGYIIGATVYLDLNFNNQLDANEPNVVTKEEGGFDLNIPSTYAECSQYVPMVVDVPAGAIDTDFPDTPIESAYKMVIPPKYALSTDEDLINLTPLTSVIWSEVKRELDENTSSDLSCGSMLKEQELRDDIENRILEQEKRVARRYNITVDELYGDYIESANVLVHQIAQDIVPGLQKSYADTRALLSKYPEADIAWVEYFLGQWDSSGDEFDDAWYRHQLVQTSNGNLQSETYEMSSDLNTKVRLHDQSIKETTVRDGVNIEKNISLELHNNIYHCSLSEWLETVSEQSSGVRNTVYGQAGDWADCSNGIITNEFITQALVTKNYNGNVPASYTEHTYYEENDSGFRHLIGVTSTITADDLTPVRSIIDTDFYSEEGHGANFWSRTKNEFNTNPTQVMTTHTSDGDWSRYTTYENGTHTSECGTSESNLSEINCSE
ncbi:hypothetical protein AB3A93_000201 [Vibrio parahaemolyticus]|nr:hypothetical protein [Vibrio parahaemolyticus]